MNRLYLALIFTIVILLGYSVNDAISDVTSSGASTTQSNVSGSNTSIQGYEATTNNTYQGQVTNSTTNSTSNSTNQETAVNPANAPAMSVYGTGGDSCSLVVSGGISLLGISFSAGGYVVEDEDCSRLKKAKMLLNQKMVVASIGVMCLDYEVWLGMWNAGTPCVIDGLIGEEAKKRWIEVGGFYRTKEKNNEKYFTNSSNTNNSKFRHHR